MEETESNELFIRNSRDFTQFMRAVDTVNYHKHFLLDAMTLDTDGGGFLTVRFDGVELGGE